MQNANILQNRTVELSIIVNMSAINIKMSKKQKRIVLHNWDKKDCNTTETCYYIFSFLDYMRALYDRFMGHSNGIKSESQGTVFQWGKKKKTQK